jgi:uncharacterized protein (DUF302 family)
MNPSNGIISQPSKFSVAETIDRLESALQAKGIKIFARIDQKREAENVGLTMQLTELLVFGNPKAGTPLMVAVPLSAIDLPLKALAWQDSQGSVWLSYNDSKYLQQRFSLSDELIQTIAAVEPLLQQAIA